METIYGKLNKQIESVYYTPINTDTATITIDKDLKTIKVDVNVDFILKDVKVDIDNIDNQIEAIDSRVANIESHLSGIGDVLENKLDKIHPEKVPGLMVYGRDAVDTNIGINARPSIQYGGFNLIYRDANARAEIETPIDSKQIANKEYVDNTIAKVSVEKQSISGDALDIIYGATRNVGFDFSKRTPILGDTNITATNEIIEAMENNETIVGLMQSGEIRGNAAPISSFTHDANTISFFNFYPGVGVGLKFNIEQGKHYYINNISGSNISATLVLWYADNAIHTVDFSHGWTSSVTGFAFVLFVPVATLNKTTINHFEIVTDDKQVVFELTDKSKPDTVVKRNSNGNIDEIEQLTKVMPTDINVDSNNYLILEHDGTEITAQKKLVKMPVANPTTTGAEETLKAIKVGDTSYVLPNANGDIAVEIDAIETAKNGTLTAEQLATLQANETNYIMFNHEKYYLMDKGHTEGYLTYTHVGYENNQQWIKAITITISTLAWVLNVTGVEKERHHVTIKGTGQASSSLTKSYLFRFDIYLDKGVSLGTSINSLCSALGPSKFTVNGFFTADDVVNNITEFIIPQTTPAGAPSTWPYVLYGPEDTESTHFNEFTTTVTDNIYND